MPPPPTPTQPYAPNPNTNFFNTVLNPNAIPTTTPTATPPRPVRPFEPQPQQAFTATQRSLQARNKNHNTAGSPRREKEAESYEARQRREEASRILESTEMMIWLSNARNEVCETNRPLRLLVCPFLRSRLLHLPSPCARILPRRMHRC